MKKSVISTSEFVNAMANGIVSVEMTYKRFAAPCAYSVEEMDAQDEIVYDDEDIEEAHTDLVLFRALANLEHKVAITEPMCVMVNLNVSVGYRRLDAICSVLRSAIRLQYDKANGISYDDEE